jgi:hypothetical protein
MAKKISDLTALTALADADVFVVVDDSVSTTKKITAANAKTYMLTSATMASPTINTEVSGTAILDEDDLASDSNTQLATQQSIKAYVDGYEDAVSNANDNPNVSDTALDIATNVTEANWESVGPTGAGADNTWAALDSIVSGATHIKVKLVLIGTSVPAAQAQASVYARGGDGAQGIDLDNMLARIISSGTGGAGGGEFTIPVDSSGVFDVYWTGNYNDSHTIQMFLIKSSL